MSQSIAFIGVGNMGFPMAENLMKADKSVKVFDVSKKMLEIAKNKNLETIDNKSKLRHRVHFHVLQEYARSGVFERFIIIDNTNLPYGGPEPKDTLMIEYSSTNTYQMTYNYRDISIIIGILCFIFIIIISILAYVGFKMNEHIKDTYWEIPVKEE